MRNKNRKIGKRTSSKIRGVEKSSAFRKYRVAQPGFEPLTIFARSPGEALSVARRLNGLRRLVADLAVIRDELEGGPTNKLRGLFALSDTETQLAEVLQGGRGPRKASELKGGLRGWLN